MNSYIKQEMKIVAFYLLMSQTFNAMSSNNLKRSEYKKTL